MNLDLSGFHLKNKTVAVAVSGGADSMALLYYMLKFADYYGFKVIALNVEHGIRGETSVKDSVFVENSCRDLNIPCLSYKVDSLEKAKNDKLSVEQAARMLRYDCFNDALNKGTCDVVATAHHRSDNAESVLLNIFRGTGLKGLIGINENYSDRIIRPMLGVSREEIDNYVAENAIPFVTDETNLSDDYTRNFLRLNVIPKIKEIFPEMEKSISRLSEIAESENEFMDETAKDAVTISSNKAELRVTAHPAVLRRAVVIALKTLGLKKDWEKVHADGVVGLKSMQNGSSITLPKGLFAIREYDKIVISKKPAVTPEEIPFSLGKTKFGDYTVIIEKTDMPQDLKSGFYADLDKIPATAFIRSKKIGDGFVKFGGGTKTLGDFFTDIKLPLRLRNNLPVLADGNNVLCIFGVAISDKIKVDDSTRNIIKITRE